jgi:hypothetical protein
MSKLLLKENIKEIIAFHKSNMEWLAAAIMQSAIIYGALAVLLYAALGEYAEGGRRFGSGFIQGLLDATIFVLLMRRCFDGDRQKSDTFDLRFKKRELKVWFFQQVQLLFYLPSSLIMVLLPRLESGERSVAILAGVAMICFGIMIVYLRLRFLFMPALAADSQKGIWKQSWQMTKGRILQLLLLAAAVLVPWILISMVARLVDVFMPTGGFGVYALHTVFEMAEYYAWVLPMFMLQIFLYRQSRQQPAAEIVQTASPSLT